MHAHSEKAIIHWGGKNAVQIPIAVGVPNLAENGGNTSPAADAATVLAALGATNSHDESAQVLKLTPIAGVPVSAIGIAPDSLIPACDIALGGNGAPLRRFRIAPGNPLVGCIDETDMALVTIPVAMPLILDNSNFDVLDATDVAQVGSDTYRGWPLRLELWRGDPVQIRVNDRAPFHGYSIVANTNSGTVRRVIACVAGRRRIDVFVTPDAAGPASVTVDIHGGEPIKSVTAPSTRLLDEVKLPQLPLDEFGATSLVATSAAPLYLSFEGNPMTLIVVDLTGGTGGAPAGPVHVRINAWDY